nr:MAG TPA: hypothetical protein [Bacteriophage sp.]
MSTVRGIRRKPSANPRSDEQKPDIRHDVCGRDCMSSRSPKLSGHTYCKSGRYMRRKLLLLTGEVSRTRIRNRRG